MSKSRSYDLKITVTCRLNSTEEEVQKTIALVNRDLARAKAAAADGDQEASKALVILKNIFGNNEELNEQNFDVVTERLLRKGLRDDFRQTKELDFSSKELVGHQITVDVTPRGVSKTVAQPTAAWPFPTSK